MIQTKISSTDTCQKPSMTPKAIIHQRFGAKACYKVEEVDDATHNGCPGLAIAQKGPCLYRCTLQLPDISVVSGTFRRKKEAEQSAAELAIEKLGICQKEYKPTVEEAWEDLAGRLSFLFADESLSSLHPLSGHSKAALRRGGHFKGCIPVSVFAAYDTKISNICKFILNEAEVNSQVVIPLILRAATKLTDLVLKPDEQLSLKRKVPYPLELISSLTPELNLCESTPIEAIYIPASFHSAVEPLTLHIAATDYYLDVIACELGLTEASDLLISGTIGKSSSEVRIYSSAPKQHFLNQLCECKTERPIHFKGSLNTRASYFAGQEIYGDAILASIGYTWRSTDLGHESVSLCSYYRMLMNMIPSGIYKISREAILTANLPSTFTTKSNWRGSLPRDVLCAFCRFHHLSEPAFSTQSKLSVSSLDIPGSGKKLTVTELTEGEQHNPCLLNAQGNTEESTEAFNCEVKIYSKKQQLILQCSPHEWHRKQIDAMQSSALKVLSWLNIFFLEPDMSTEKLNVLAEKFNIHFTPVYFFKEFEFCCSMHKNGNLRSQSCNDIVEGVELVLIDFGGKSTGGVPSNGSLACISYTVLLYREDDGLKEHLESCEEFEFEIGNEAVLPYLESAVVQITVGQSTYFRVDLPPVEFILAAASDSAATLSMLSSGSCKLEYCITLLRVTQPLEERMEQALFSPPLSKQRVEFALQHIKESSAVSLVDFGCGSGSLLDSLLSYSTSLQKIVGVDISQRSLARAAKSLDSKLNRLLEAKDPSNKIKSAMLFDGSITNFDSRLFGFDIATCLEVIEHMEEEDAHLFGDVVLSTFCPRILIVSTPNYEYNVILQKSTSPGQDVPDEKNEQQACKFRNHDHKFEWTRVEFEQWASGLAGRHNYGVKFSGVGGAGDVEPGFASQIAIFRRLEEKSTGLESISEGGNPYVPIWQWSINEVQRTNHE